MAAPQIRGNDFGLRNLSTNSHPCPHTSTRPHTHSPISHSKSNHILPHTNAALPRPQMHALTLELEDKDVRLNHLYVTNARLLQENGMLGVQVCAGVRGRVPAAVVSGDDSREYERFPK